MTVSTHMVQANGLRFRALVDGPPDGDLFVMLHGFPEGAESWSHQLRLVAGAGFLAVAPDLRGYGLTDAPDGVASYSLDHLVEDVSGLIGAFGRKSAHVAGHDWGAVVAWYFAAAHPEMTASLSALSAGRRRRARPSSSRGRTGSRSWRGPVTGSSSSVRRKSAGPCANSPRYKLLSL